MNNIKHIKHRSSKNTQSHKSISNNQLKMYSQLNSQCKNQILLSLIKKSIHLASQNNLFNQKLTKTTETHHLKSYLNQLLSHQISFYTPLQTKVNPSIRAKLLDWMLQVSSYFSENRNTIFLAYDIMDWYLHDYQGSYPNSELHLLGVVAYFLASKLEQKNPISMKQVIQQVSHKAFTSQKIKNKQFQIISLLSNKLWNPTFYNFLDIYLKLLFNQSIFSKEIMFLLRNSIFNYLILAKNSKIMFAHKKSELVIACIYQSIIKYSCQKEQVKLQSDVFITVKGANQIRKLLLTANQSKQILCCIKNIESHLENNSINKTLNKNVFKFHNPQL